MSNLGKYYEPHPICIVRRNMISEGFLFSKTWVSQLIFEFLGRIYRAWRPLIRDILLRFLSEVLVTNGAAQ